MSRVQYSSHGGGCCGISHVWNFNDQTDRLEFTNIHNGPVVTLTEAIARIDEGRCLEIVLTDEQIEDATDLCVDLRNAGFELVSRFYNSNSGNMCNVLHKVREQFKHEGPWHELPANVAPPAPAPDLSMLPEMVNTLSVGRRRRITNQRIPEGLDITLIKVVLDEVGHNMRTGTLVVPIGGGRYRPVDPCVGNQYSAAPTTQFISDVQLRDYNA